MTRQTLFEDPVLERDLGDDLLELAVLVPQLLDLVAGGFPNRVPGKLRLPGLEEVLAPANGMDCSRTYP
jgi:hypothetical protein